MKDEHVSRSGSLLSPPFLVAVGLLVAAAVLAGPLADMMGYTKIKKALELKADFSTLNTSAIGPYEVVDRRVHQPSIIEALGTDTYLSWTLKDTSLPAGDPLEFAVVDVTYYSGGHNLVPHTPDVCVRGAGYQLAEAQNLAIEVPSLGSEHSPVPVRICTFEKTSIFEGEQFSVLYTFFCNGHFVALRTEVRLLILDPTDMYAFFSKVEVNFPQATPEQTIEGARKLLGYLAPVLIRDHWPDFQAAEQQARSPDPVAVDDGR